MSTPADRRAERLGPAHVSLHDLAARSVEPRAQRIAGQHQAAHPPAVGHQPADQPPAHHAGGAGDEDEAPQRPRLPGRAARTSRPASSRRPPARARRAPRSRPSCRPGDPRRRRARRGAAAGSRTRRRRSARCTSTSRPSARASCAPSPALVAPAHLLEREDVGEAVAEQQDRPPCRSARTARPSRLAPGGSLTTSGENNVCPSGSLSMSAMSPTRDTVLATLAIRAPGRAPPGGTSPWPVRKWASSPGDLLHPGRRPVGVLPQEARRVAGAQRRRRRIEDQHAGRAQLGREPARSRGCARGRRRRRRGRARAARPAEASPCRARGTAPGGSRARRGSARSRGSPAADRVRRGASPASSRLRRASSTSGSRNGGPPSAVMPGA